MNNYNIEVTDTFSGEANYCWVHRYKVKAKSILGAAQKLSRLEGLNFRKDYGDNMSARYNAQGACICAFITYSEEV